MADEADLSAIRAWVASGGQMGVDREGNPVVPESAINPPTPAAPSGAQAQQPAEPETPGERAADEAEQDRAEQRAEQRQRPPKQAAKRGPLKGLMNWAANVPTPGGNLALVLILIFFAFAIIPVNAGRTRLQLIWDVLTGNAELPGTGQASGATSASGVGDAIGTGIGIGIGSVIGAGGLSANTSGNASGNASGLINPQQQSGAGPTPVYDAPGLGNSLNPLALLEAPRGDW